MSTALLTSGRRSEFLRQSDPARPGPRVLLRTADSSSGSLSHECVAARSDLCSHTLRRSVFFFFFCSGGSGREFSLVRSYRPGCRLISSTDLAPWPRDRSVTAAHLTSGRRSEFLQQSDPARPGPRVLPRTADSSSGSPSPECVAARSSDLYSHTLPKICLFFRSEGRAAISVS
ncbi:hypothetical protein NDU88_007597 [Pleurodeles waltl]|uniref:Uncharacterized protein n=1 Tax=Pleurodeles waltl TaxID=8319 RepID=A0AAV7PM53_PLEWA|nr:hypothetical protein NDU88_007597 [Pleurodeles waltl]